MNLPARRIGLGLLLTGLSLCTPLRAAPAAAAESAFEAVVESQRQSVLAAQVAGAVVALEVKVGETVRAGQTLLRLDARAAEQGAQASEAQALATRAQLDLASRDFERQKRLREQGFISEAALEQAQAQYKAQTAQLQAQLAQSQAVRTQGSFYVIRAPFDGVVSELPVQLGDMATPGRPLITVVDPHWLRITAAVPQALAPAKGSNPPSPRLEVPALGGSLPAPTRVQWLPTVDPVSHTVQMRAELPAGTAGLAPGMFARVWLPSPRTDGRSPVLVPLQAVVRRGEMTAVYVQGQQGQALLRQVRLGEVRGTQIEVLSGLSAQDRLASR